MSTAPVTARVDTNVKKEANEVLEGLGLNMTTAINMFLSQVVKRRAIPFEIAEQPRYNDETMEAIYEARLISEGRLPAKIYTSTKEALDEAWGEDV